MRTPREKSRWLQGGLIVLIILMLAFLAISPNLRAHVNIVQSDEIHITNQHHEGDDKDEI
jgi:hypothetical protein